jgi:multiple sugar transport system ATP-binding protein
LTVRDLGESPTGFTQLTGLVEVVEPLGAETIIEFNCSGQSLIARMPGDVLPAIGDSVPLSVGPARLYVFDKSTGERIRTQH